MDKGFEGQMEEHYWNKLASTYDVLALPRGLETEHEVALRFMVGFMQIYGLSSILDVGSGTGRAVKYFLDHGFQTMGIEPNRSMIREAEKKGIPVGTIWEGKGDSLPWKDNTFDAVCECGVLHHVRRPASVVAEMLRVARKAVFISDGNRFAGGRRWVRKVKVLVYKIKLGKMVEFILSSGRGYKYAPKGDGLFYSYSIYDSLNQISVWADRVIIIPTHPGPQSYKQLDWSHPLLTSHVILLCGFKEDSAHSSPR